MRSFTLQYITLHCTKCHYTTLSCDLPYPWLQYKLDKPNSENKRGKNKIIAPSGKKDCSIRMFTILVWIWKLVSHPLYKSFYSVSFCWAWVISKLKNKKKINAVCVISYNTSHAQLIKVLKNKRKHNISLATLWWVIQYIIMSCSDCCKILGSSYPVSFEHYVNNHGCDFDRPNTSIVE